MDLERLKNSMDVEALGWEVESRIFKHLKVPRSEERFWHQHQEAGWGAGNAQVRGSVYLSKLIVRL